MKTEKEMLESLNTAITNAVRADSMGSLRFYQGQINILEWYFEKPEQRKDGFEGEIKEKKDES